MSDVSASEKQDEAASIEEALKRERYELLRHVEDSLETPMPGLAFVWLALLVVELIWGESLLFAIIGTIIWVIFILYFAVEFVLAPHKVAYLAQLADCHFVTDTGAAPLPRLPGVSAAPAGPRGAEFAFAPRRQLADRGMRALGASLSRRGFGYVIALTVLVMFTGAAGMYAFENVAPDGMNSYGEALWWTPWSSPRWARSTGRTRLRGACCASSWRCMLLPSSAT